MGPTDPENPEQHIERQAGRLGCLGGKRDQREILDFVEEAYRGAYLDPAYTKSL
jgi:hypothetical protein